MIAFPFRLPKAEAIGPQACPLFLRWTLLAPRWRRRPALFKILLHHFLPDRIDRDAPHDHPRAFVTIVLRGSYIDWVPCPHCAGRRGGCAICQHSGEVVADVLCAPAIRLRPAEYAHRTQGGPAGAWTLVFMGRERRRWGFWAFGTRFTKGEYQQRFDRSFSCD